MTIEAVVFDIGNVLIEWQPERFYDATYGEARRREMFSSRKAAELAPFVEAALARKTWMQPLADADIPVVRASVAKAQTAGSLA